LALEFEWDPLKEASNITKHGVTFTEAMTVFADPLETTIADPDHSDDEFRFISVGMSVEMRLLVVGYTERGSRIRLISARPAAPRERRAYESETTA
jgi:uncharacterized DUF497 family protein